MKNTNDFSKCKVGDKLWSIELGECEVTEILRNGLRCSNESENYLYYFNGKYYPDAKCQSLYFSNPNIIAPEKPKEKIPFDLEMALSGEYDLVTRDGREVQEWKFFEKATESESICYVVDGDLYNAFLDGKLYLSNNSDFDLFLIEK